MCRPGCGSLRDPFAGGHIGPPLRGGRGIQEATGIGAKTDLASGAGRSPPPTGWTGGVRGGVRSPRPTEAPQVVPSNGPMWASAPTKDGKVPSTTRASGAQRSVCAAVARKGWKSEQRASPKCPATSDNPSVTAKPCQLPLHKGALGTGDADCRVGPAGLLAMTMVFCHSEERSDVGIRPFYDGRGFGPPYLGHGLRQPNFVPKFGASVIGIGPCGWLQRAATTTRAAL